MKCLFIDDSTALLRSLRSALKNSCDVTFVECHSVEEALQAVAENKPDVLFLDHSLTDGGDEGFEIAEKVGGHVVIYSTTANPEAVEAYRRRGIEHVGKRDLEEIKSILATGKRR